MSQGKRKKEADKDESAVHEKLEELYRNENININPDVLNSLVSVLVKAKESKSRTKLYLDVKEFKQQDLFPKFVAICGLEELVWNDFVKAIVDANPDFLDQNSNAAIKDAQGKKKALKAATGIIQGFDHKKMEQLKQAYMRKRMLSLMGHSVDLGDARLWK